MPPVAAMASGFVATLALTCLVIVGPTFSPTVSSSEIVPSSDIAQSVNRSSKSDRLPAPVAAQQRPAQPNPTPVKTLQEDNRQRMEGCDPLVSPLAKSSLSQVPGRCIAAMSSRDKPA
jgi:hypothetical protein